MKTIVASCYVLSMAGAMATLAGCGGSQLPIGAPGAMPQSQAMAAHADRGGSWMLPAAKSEDLIYLSEYVGSGDAVYVYSYLDGKQVGMISGLKGAGGLCGDRAGDVFVTERQGQDILEYAHGSTVPKADLSDTGYDPNGCDVDPRTGDLAVANYCGKSGSDCIGSNAGNVVIYSRARGKPKSYQSPNVAQYGFCGYDGSGNLYTGGDGPPGNSGYHFLELGYGKTSFRTITLDEKNKFGDYSDIQWDGSHIVVGDNGNFTLYQFTIKGSHGTTYGSTLLRSALFYQFWIEGDKVLATTTRYDYKERVNFYDYPSGRFARGFGGYRAYGITVSRDRSR
jgi:hypothetical protein